jgi:hypothetical protein
MFSCLHEPEGAHDVVQSLTPVLFCCRSFVEAVMSLCGGLCLPVNAVCSPYSKNYIKHLIISFTLFLCAEILRGRKHIGVFILSNAEYPFQLQ